MLADYRYRACVAGRRHALRRNAAAARAVGRICLVAATVLAEQQVGRDADTAELFDRMLRGLGLELARRTDERHQREVNEHHPVAAQLIGQLADGFEKRQPLDIADRAADFNQCEIRVIDIRHDGLLDGVGDSRPS